MKTELLILLLVLVVNVMIASFLVGVNIGKNKVYKSNVRHEVMYEKYGTYHWLNEFKLIGEDE